VDATPDLVLRRKNTIALILILIATIIWGSQYILVKWAVDSIPPLLFQAIRHFIAFLAFLPVWGLFRKMDKITFVGALLSAIVMSILVGFITYGIQYTTSNKSAFLATMYVVFTPFVSYAMLKAKIKHNQILAVTVAVIGMAFLIFGDSGSTDLEIAPNIGDLLVLIGAFFNAIQIVLIEKYVKHVNVFLFVMTQMILISIILSLVAFIAGERVDLGAVSGQTWGIILYLAILGTTITLCIQTWAQNFIDSTRAALLYSLEPVFAIFFGVLLGGEKLTVAFGIGAFLIMVGILWSSKK
jgi:drug/metabolite transporter (DMT)-like permease